MTNILVNNNILPPFESIAIDQIEAAIDTRLADCREGVEAVVKQAPSWLNLVEPMEDLDDQLAQTWSPVGHLHAVMNSDELRLAYNATLPLLSCSHRKRQCSPCGRGP